jgi:hypothetical protein
MRGVGETAECLSPRNVDERATKALDVVGTIRGKQPAQLRYKYCAIQRGDNLLESWLSATCGRQGRWFEPLIHPKASREQSAA